jgi:hypothetical protein
MALRDNSIPSSDNRTSLLGTVAGESNAKCRLADFALGGGERSQTDRSDLNVPLALSCEIVGGNRWSHMAVG